MASFKQLIEGETPVLVDFYTDWCGPCKMMAPVLSEVASDVGEMAKVIKVNVDKNPEAAMKYGVQGVPTFILFKRGEIVWRRSGVVPGSVLVNAIEAA